MADLYMCNYLSQIILRWMLDFQTDKFSHSYLGVEMDDYVLDSQT